MATTPQDIKGPFAVVGRLEAFPGKADELAQLLANAKAYVDSGTEPGTLQYHIVRFSDSFAVFEAYADLDAFSLHRSSESVQKVINALSTLAKKRDVTFWSMNSLPKPTAEY